MQNNVQHGLAPRQVLSTAEFAFAVGTGTNRVLMLVRAGRVRHVRHGRRVVIPATEVAAFLEREAKGGK